MELKPSASTPFADAAKSLVSYLPYILLAVGAFSYGAFVGFFDIWMFNYYNVSTFDVANVAGRSISNIGKITFIISMIFIIATRTIVHFNFKYEYAMIAVASFMFPIGICYYLYDIYNAVDKIGSDATHPMCCVSIVFDFGKVAKGRILTNIQLVIGMTFLVSAVSLFTRTSEWFKVSVVEFGKNVATVKAVTFVFLIAVLSLFFKIGIGMGSFERFLSAASAGPIDIHYTNGNIINGKLLFWGSGGIVFFECSTNTISVAPSGVARVSFLDIRHNVISPACLTAK